jgi:hypothetical protein
MVQDGFPGHALFEVFDALIVHPRILVAINRTSAEGGVTVIKASEPPGDESLVSRL